MFDYRIGLGYAASMDFSRMQTKYMCLQSRLCLSCSYKDNEFLMDGAKATNLSVSEFLIKFSY